MDNLEENPVVVSKSLSNQVKKIQDECEHLKHEILKKESLACDMVDYLCDNISVDIQRHFSSNDFVSNICIETPCLLLPPSNSADLCPLTLLAYVAEIQGDQTVISIQLFNQTNKRIRHVSGTLLSADESEFCLANTQSCLMDLCSDNVPFYADSIRPRSTAYLVISHSNPVEPKEFSLHLKCYVENTEKRLPSSQSSSYARNCVLSPRNWSFWCGRMQKLIQVDAWATTNSHTFGDSQAALPLGITLKAAFLRRISVEADAAADFLDDTRLNLTKISDLVYGPNQSNNKSNLLIILQKSEEFQNLGQTRFVLFSTEATADRFLRHLLHLKLCSRIEEFDAQSIKHLKSETYLDDVALKTKENLMHLLDQLKTQAIERMDGGKYRTLKAELSSLELNYLHFVDQAQLYLD